MIQACKGCGSAFDLEFIPKNPFKLCPNPSCKLPLDADAVEHKFVEANNPSDRNDSLRLDLRAQMHNDVAAHGGDTSTMQEKIAAGLLAQPSVGDRRVIRITKPIAAPKTVTIDAFRRIA